jgi:polyribonucleotide nucleotidyltransferase
LLYFLLQVSKVSDIVSVGQVLSLTCIGQDVRGNIKLSLKATLPGRHKKELASQDTAPLANQDLVGWAAVENMASKDADVEQSSRKDEDITTGETPEFSTPAVIIRSAADCDAQDVADGPTKKQSKVAKSSPRVNKPAKERQEARTASPKKASSTSAAKKNKKGKADDSGSNGLDAIPEQDISNTLKSSTNFRSGSMKLGDVVTVKVYQIRAYGLVLELSDGVRGMHKFVVISYPTLRCSLLVHAAVITSIVLCIV